MIQEYLNAQFIKIADDANFEKLKKTCTDVAKKIAKDRSKILAYSLIAFDPEIPATNKEIVEIRNLIIEYWQTFVPNSKDTALTVVRAIMLEALQTVSKETSSACIIWFASRNAYKHFKLGREEEMLTSFLLGIANTVEKEVAESWSFSPDHEIEIPKITAALIDDADFAAGLTAATVKEATNKALKKQITELKENQKKFVDLVGLMQVRTQLLWWKEAGYSPSIRETYKDKKDGLLQVLLAYDYCNFIPEMYPASADYFLLEAHKALSENAGKKIKISEFIKMVEQYSADLRTTLPEFTLDDGRVSFANFIKGLVHEKYKVSQFKSLVGVASTTELTLADLTLWLFHDFHSIKITIAK